LAANLAQLANSISESIRGIGAELGIISENTGALYPDVLGDIKTNFSLENWNKLPFPYTLEVIDVTTGDTAIGFQPFALPLAPTKISQTEQPATSIKPTQGGTVVTHSGNKYKKLSIEGTTGINPFRGMTGVNSTTGRAIAKPNDLKYKSGYEVANELKNYIKAYYEFKANPTGSIDPKNARLLFKNFKDGEFLIIEIIDFTSDRNADRSLIYDYKIDAKVLAHFSFAPPGKSFFEELDSQINRVVSKIDVARGIFLSRQELLRQIESSYDNTILEPMRKIGLAAKALGGISITAADIGNRIIKNTVTALDSLNILQVIQDQKNAARTGQSTTVALSIQNQELPRDLNQATQNRGADTITELDATLFELPLSTLPESTQNSMIQEIEDASTLPRSFYEDTVNDLIRIKNNAEDKFNLGSNKYDSIFNRTTTLAGETGKVVTPEEFEVLGAFNDSIVAINTLISFPNLFKSEFARRIETIQEQFAESLNLQALPAVKQITLPAFTDLERIALEELGDPTRWVEIAELNDLNYPYIVQDQSDTRSNIKRPGDQLLIPQQIQFGLSNAPQAKDIPSTEGLSETEKSLGTDLKLTDNMDLDLGGNGDLGVVSGIQNMAQAVVLKIGIERTELKNHPELGVGAVVGNKFLSLEQVRDNLISTLKQDDRIENISNVALLREGPALYMSFFISIRNVDTPIPLRVKL
jgi:hypothetical protein